VRRPAAGDELRPAISTVVAVADEIARRERWIA
jgi:hypothetical protein